MPNSNLWISKTSTNLPLLDEPMPPMMGRYTHDHTKAWSAKVASFNGYVFVTPEYNHGTSAALKNAIDAAKNNSEPIHLVVQSENYVNNFDIDYHDGERYPVLERAEGTPDYLDDITKPLTTPEKAAETKKAEE